MGTCIFSLYMFLFHLVVVRHFVHNGSACMFGVSKNTRHSSISEFQASNYPLVVDCPPEFREAVSNLIFVVARYPDLPELCDLRHIFTERNGNFVEHFVSQEFIQKLDSTEFTNEERFQVMQSVAEELSVSFDAKDCPPEFREAVSNLIFAVARYPDLPELCDLRHIFTERYGNFVEHFVSQEFIQKLDSTEFTNEERFQVMQSVAEELSVSFDAKLMQRMQPEAAETAIDCGNLFPRNADGQMRHNSGRGGDMDEEERMMDKLLMHYSKKGLDLTNNETHTDAAQKDSFSLMDSLEEENKVPVDESQLDKDATFDNGSPLNTNIVVQEDELYPITDMAQICSAERRVLLYLDHDMVFIPINIRGTHWYLAVINARNMEIQVLDSLGTTFDRNDLTDSYWTGDELSDSFTQ
ncbi:hypothetical protein ACJX0J_012423, partial [Zea mays]